MGHEGMSRQQGRALEWERRGTRTPTYRNAVTLPIELRHERLIKAHAPFQTFKTSRPSIGVTASIVDSTAHRFFAAAFKLFHVITDDGLASPFVHHCEDISEPTFGRRAPHTAGIPLEKFSQGKMDGPASAQRGDYRDYPFHGKTRG